MKFNKTLIASSALLLALGGLASCQSRNDRPNTKPDTDITVPDKDPDTDKDPEVKPGEDTSIKGNVIFWSNVYGKREEAWRDAVVKDFNKVYPNIKVEVVGAGRYGDINKKVLQNLNTPAKLPNMVVGYPDFFTTYFDKLLNLEPFINDPNIGFGKIHNDKGEVVDDVKTKKDDMIASYIEEGSNFEKEGIYALPFGKTTEACFVNDTILKELQVNAPTTWSEAIEISKKMLAKYPDRYVYEKDGKNVTGVYAPISFHSTANFYITFSDMLGIPYASNVDTNKDGRLGKSEAVKFNNDQAKKFVKELKSLFDQGLFTTKDITAALGGQQYVENDFVKKDPTTIIMYDSTKGTSYVANSINEKNDTIPGAQHEASAHSVLKADVTGFTAPTKATAINQGGSIAFFDKNAQDNKAAWLFYKFMMNTDNSAAYSIANSTQPVRKSSYEVEGIKNIINGKDTEVKVNDWNSHFAKLNGEVFSLYKSYPTDAKLVAAPVNNFSSKQRSEVESMLINILTSKEKDVDALIEREFQAAYDNI